MPWVQWGAVIGASLAAAVFDITQRKIPNRLTGPVVVGGLVWSFYTCGWGGLCDSLAACVLLALPFVVLFVFAGGGAGDAKMMGAVGAWLGLVNGVVALVAVAISGIVLAVAFAAGGKRLRSTLTNAIALLYALVARVMGPGKLEARHAGILQTPDSKKMPYGLAILVGVCLAAGGIFLWAQ